MDAGWLSETVSCATASGKMRGDAPGITKIVAMEHYNEKLPIFD